LNQFEEEIFLSDSPIWSEVFVPNPQVNTTESQESISSTISSPPSSVQLPSSQEGTTINARYILGVMILKRIAAFYFYD